jgi:hypothetical protein
MRDNFERAKEPMRKRTVTLSLFLPVLPISGTAYARP